MAAHMTTSKGTWGFSYGWVVVSAGLLITMTVSGINASIAVFFKPLLQSFEWSRGQASLIWVTNWLTFSVLSAFIGLSLDRFGARNTMLAGGVLFSFGVLFSSQATSLWHLFLLFGLLSSVGRVTTFMPVAVTVVRWFDRHQGLALGLAQSYVVGVFVISPLAAWLITSYGWQQAFLVLGGLALVIVVPLTFFIRESPGATAHTPQPRQTPKPPRDFNLGQAVRTRTFWSLKLMVLGCCTCHSFLLLHLVNHLTDQGLTMSHAAKLLGLLGVASMFGRVANGLCADRFGAKPAIAGFLLVQGLGVLLFLRPDHWWLLYLGIVVWGAAQGGPMPCYAMLYRQYFGKRHLATVMSSFYAVGGLGMALGGLLGGVLYDATGGYQLAFAISLIGGVGAACIAASLQPPDRSPRVGAGGIEEDLAPA